MQSSRVAGKKIEGLDPKVQRCSPPEPPGRRRRWKNRTISRAGAVDFQAAGMCKMKEYLDALGRALSLPQVYWDSIVIYTRLTPAAVGFLYDKFCNAGWSGYGGEEPCNDLDACCSDHNHFVKKKGARHNLYQAKPSTCILEKLHGFWSMPIRND